MCAHKTRVDFSADTQCLCLSITVRCVVRRKLSDFVRSNIVTRTITVGLTTDRRRENTNPGRKEEKQTSFKRTTITIMTIMKMMTKAMSMAKQTKRGKTNRVIMREQSISSSSAATVADRRRERDRIRATEREREEEKEKKRERDRMKKRVKLEGPKGNDVPRVRRAATITVSALAFSATF